MGFTVAHQGGTKDSEFQAYARLLRQRGVDLARMPRVPEPSTGKRWLYCWEKEADAKDFADELTKRTRDPDWYVQPVDAPASEGPLGPIEVRLGRRSNGWAFELHPLSRAMLESLFPKTRIAPNVFIGARPDNHTGLRGADLPELARRVALLLTGLTDEELYRVGYRVMDADTEAELVAVPPAEGPRVNTPPLCSINL